ncbi:MAG: zinc-dependent alcohol dehydrogenase family protein [Saprospiraceae bacterium]
MKAALFTSFQSPLKIENVPDPTPFEDSVIIRVKATGICRSDWHGWMGHDGDVQLPHVPGHELAGIVEAVGKKVHQWKIGDRVTVPFSGGCGFCPQCNSGNQQICDNYFQPGFTAWGSFAEYVNIKFADENLVRLPEQMDFVEAASLGCRFITSFRGVVDQGRVSGGEWVVVFGCGGVGLSAIMIANAMGANVVAIDIEEEKLAFAKTVGAIFTINSKNVDNLPESIQNITSGGAHLTIDALGSQQTCRDAILSLRKRGRHVQIGLLAGKEADPPIPMGTVLSKELEIIGSHGMQAHRYPEMMEMILSGKLKPKQLIGRKVDLEEGAKILTKMNEYPSTGVIVIDRF